MMITFLLFLNFMLMLLMPIMLGLFIGSRRHVGGRLFGVGAAGFVISQLFHLPFNWLVLERFSLISSENLIILAIFLGLSAGVFEEVTRYLIYRFWITDARSWGQGLMFGAGWGGIEAIILGVLGFYGLMQIVMFQNNPLVLESLPLEQLNLVKTQLSELLTLPWYMFLLGAIERVFTLCFHLAASIMVLQAFLRKNILWLLAAILWHALLDSGAVYAAATWGAVPAEALLGFMSIFSLGIIFWLRTPEPVEPELEPLAEIGPAKLGEVELSSADLEKSKYS